MTVKFLKSASSFAYFAGDVADIDDEKAKDLIEKGFCTIPVDAVKNESQLPEDFPCRDILAKNGFLTVEQVVEIKDCLAESVKGVGESSAHKIIEYLNGLC